jgi:hypothetical protein
MTSSSRRSRRRALCNRALDPEDPKRKPSRLSVERLADGFGMRTRIKPMVEVLQARGALSARQSRAGIRIYQCWALGICGARDSDAPGNGSDPGGYTDAQMDAAREYRLIRDAVGPRLWPAVFATAVEDWSPSRFANERGHGMHKAAALERLRIGLDLAADAIGDM